MALTEVPYHKDGYMMEGIYRWYNKADYEFRPNAPFEAVLSYKDTGYGASNPKFYFENEETGLNYPMFFSEFMRLFENGLFDGTKTKPLLWHAVKRGSAYGIVTLNV
jgi:hypothetical protein